MNQSDSVKVISIDATGDMSSGIRVYFGQKYRETFKDIPNTIKNNIGTPKYPTTSKKWPDKSKKETNISNASNFVQRHTNVSDCQAPNLPNN